MTRFWLVTGFVGLALLSGCDEGAGEPAGIDRASAALTTTSNIRQVIRGAADALALLEDSLLFERLGDAFGGVGTVCGAARDGQGEWQAAECYEEPSDPDFGLNETADELADWLDEAVFAPAQVESEEGSSLVIRLLPEVFCEAAFDDGDKARAPSPARPGDAKRVDGAPYEQEPAYEPEDEGGCAEFLTRVPVRLRFASYAEDEVTIDVLFGEARIDPFDLWVGPSGVSITVDLAVARQAGQVISDAYAEEGDTIEIPQVVQGALRVALLRQDEGGWTMRAAVIEPVTLDKDLNGEHSRLTVAASEMVIGAAADGATVAFSLDVGAVSLSVPYQWIVDAWHDEGGERKESAPCEPPAFPGDEPPPCEPMEVPEDGPESDPPQVSGDVSLELPALRAAATFSDASQSVALTGWGLPGGALVLAREGAPFASFSLNAGAGGVFDALVSLAQDDVRVAVSPLFDLALDLRLEALAGELEDLPSFVRDETLGVLFDDAAEPAFDVLDGGVDEALRVIAGTLTFSSTAAPDQAVSVAQGMCLSIVDEDEQEKDAPTSDAEPDPEHEILSALIAGTCPSL